MKGARHSTKIDNLQRVLPDQHGKSNHDNSPLTGWEDRLKRADRLITSNLKVQRHLTHLQHAFHKREKTFSERDEKTLQLQNKLATLISSLSPLVDSLSSLDFDLLKRMLSSFSLVSEAHGESVVSKDSSTGTPVSEDSKTSCSNDDKLPVTVSHSDIPASVQPLQSPDLHESAPRIQPTSPQETGSSHSQEITQFGHRQAPNDHVTSLGDTPPSIPIGENMDSTTSPRLRAESTPSAREDLNESTQLHHDTLEESTQLHVHHDNLEEPSPPHHDSLVEPSPPHHDSLEESSQPHPGSLGESSPPHRDNMEESTQPHSDELERSTLLDLEHLEELRESPCLHAIRNYENIVLI
eukprot:307599_1